MNHFINHFEWIIPPQATKIKSLMPKSILSSSSVASCYMPTIFLAQTKLHRRKKNCTISAASSFSLSWIWSVMRFKTSSHPGWFVALARILQSLFQCVSLIDCNHRFFEEYSSHWYLWRDQWWNYVWNGHLVMTVINQNDLTGNRAVDGSSTLVTQPWSPRPALPVLPALHSEGESPKS